jgi:hypothetical protein
MKTTLFLILAGLVLLTAGLYRAFPPKINTQFLWNNIPSALVLVLMGIALWKINDPQLIKAGTNATLRTSSAFLITLVTLMPLIGFGTVLAHHYQSHLADIVLGPFRYLWVMLSAFGVPGGSAASGPISQMWISHPESRPVLLYFLSSTPLICFTIYMVRKLGLPEDISWAMYKVNWTLAICQMPCFWIYEKFFYKVPQLSQTAIALADKVSQ